MTNKNSELKKIRIFLFSLLGIGVSLNIINSFRGVNNFNGASMLFISVAVIVILKITKETHKVKYVKTRNNTASIENFLASETEARKRQDFLKDIIDL